MSQLLPSKWVSWILFSLEWAVCNVRNFDAYQMCSWYSSFWWFGTRAVYVHGRNVGDKWDSENSYKSELGRSGWTRPRNLHFWRGTIIARTYPQQSWCTSHRWQSLMQPCSILRKKLNRRPFSSPTIRYSPLSFNQNSQCIFRTFTWATMLNSALTVADGSHFSIRLCLVWQQVCGEVFIIMIPGFIVIKSHSVLSAPAWPKFLKKSSS